MKKPYFTRKNLIALSLALFFSLVLLFVGVCLDTGEHALLNRRNPIVGISKLLGFDNISCGISGYISLFLVALYIFVGTACILYERRYAIINGKKTFSPKMILSYVLSILACAALSIGVGTVVHVIIAPESIGAMFKFIGIALLITTLIYVVLFAFFGGILMFVANFIMIDKPFRNAELNEVPEFEEEVKDVTSNFDKKFEDENIVKDVVASGLSQGAGFTASSIDGANIRNAETLDVSDKVFPALTTVDVLYEGYTVESFPTVDITLEELCVKFRNYLAKDLHLYYELDTIRFFISGLATSHFMILEGLSGTGKSSLPRYFASFVNAKLLFVPVQATWRDKTSLIGFFNDFSKTYSESEFLVSLYEANYNPDRINIFVLDEMNISRVEYYFADFLSVLEYPKEEWKIKVMQLPYEFIPPVKLENGDIKIPTNSYFIGTANKDDSTFTITDKVYDRAITIDFDDKNTPFVVTEDVSTINLSHSTLSNLFAEASLNKANYLNDEDFAKFNSITDFIYQAFDITFGNRILNQITSLVPVFVACGGTKEDALDFLLSRKVISKIEGRFEDYVKDSLKSLKSLIQKTYGASVLRRSEKTIEMLMRRL